MILVAPSRVHASNPWFKYDKIQQYCRNGPRMCYIIYYETKYGKNEEDLPTSILEIWDFGSIKICKCNKVLKTPGLYPLASAKQEKR